MSPRATTALALALLAAGATTAGTAAARGSAGPTVNVIDNAFLRGVQRPVLHVRSGTVVTWRWRSQQSHGVEVVAGPQRFAAPIRNRGAFAHRFRAAGTYRIVCPLHAPGMKMTVVVRRR